MSDGNKQFKLCEPQTFLTTLFEVIIYYYWRLALSFTVWIKVGNTTCQSLVQNEHSQISTIDTSMLAVSGSTGLRWVCTSLGCFLEQRGHQRRVLAAARLVWTSAASIVGSVQHRSVLHQAVHLVVGGAQHNKSRLTLGSPGRRDWTLDSSMIDWNLCAVLAAGNTTA